MIPNHVKPRKQHSQTGLRSRFTCDPEMDAYHNLAAAIVVQAKSDAKRLDGRDKAYLENQWITASELISFFESAWCQMLLGTTDLSGKQIRKKVGI